MVTKTDIIRECVIAGEDLRRVSLKLGISLNQVIKLAITEKVQKERVHKPKVVR